MTTISTKCSLQWVYLLRSLAWPWCIYSKQAPKKIWQRYKQQKRKIRENIYSKHQTLHWKASFKASYYVKCIFNPKKIVLLLILLFFQKVEFHYIMIIKINSNYFSLINWKLLMWLIIDKLLVWLGSFISVV